MTTRGRIKLVAFCLFAGTVINIAVAWGCSLGPYLRSRSDDSVREVVLDDETALALWNRYAGSISGHSNVRQLVASRSQTLGADQRSVTPEQYEVDIVFFEYRAGLPLYSLDAHADFSNAAGVRFHDFLELPWLSTLLRTRTRFQFPIGPHWPGLIINTLFYAAIVWLIVRSPFETRRRLRQWRGLCEKCAYPIGTSPVCTECGATIRTRSQVT